MSVNLFYPENQDIARRCQELSDDIVNMQRTLTAKFDDNETISNELRTLVNDIMTKHGYKSFDELMEKVMSTFPKDEQDRIRKVLQNMKDLNNGLDITFQVCMLITATTGVVGVGTKAFMFFRSGAFTNALASRVSQVTRLFRTGASTAKVEEKVAEVLLEETAAVAGEAATEAVSMGSRVVRFCKIVAFIGLAVDLFLIGLAAYEGHQQKEELIKNVHYLNVRRILCEVYVREAQALVNFSGQLKAVLELMKLENQEAMKPAIEALQNSFLKDVKHTYETHGVNEAYIDLSAGDGARASYLKEDLSLAEIQEEIRKQVGDPVDGPKAKDGTTVHAMVMSGGFVKMSKDVFDKPVLKHKAVKREVAWI